jgi:ATP-dependent Clp protease ATP-binding subunit ClpB
MDEAAAKLRMEMNSAPEVIDISRRKLLQLEVEREALKKEKDSISKNRLNVVKSEINQINKKLEKDLAVWEKEKLNIQEFQGLKEQLEKTKNNLDIAQRNQDYQGAAKIQYSDIPELEKKMETMSANIKNNHFIKLEVDPDDIAEIVSKWTGIPVTKLISGEKEKLLNLESKLRNRVKGQEEALKLTSDVIRMSKMGVSDEHRPIGSFLFMGNTGVGKTELAKSLAESLFDDERALVRIDMSEFMEPHSIAKLIGSPPGYVGYDEGGQLTEKIRRKPYSVILFDEIEKSHPNVLNILLQILDDGRLTDTKGRTVNFTNTIIIMTSNLKESELKSVLRPELLNRIDEIIIFDDLSKHIIEQIVEMKLEELRRKIALQKISIECDDSVKAYLIQNGYQREYGARPINRLIRREILSELSRHMLENPETEKINITIDEGEIKLTEI